MDDGQQRQGAESVLLSPSYRERAVDGRIPSPVPGFAVVHDPRPDRQPGAIHVTLGY